MVQIKYLVVQFIVKQKYSYSKLSQTFRKKKGRDKKIISKMLDESASNFSLVNFNVDWI